MARECEICNIEFASSKWARRCDPCRKIIATQGIEHECSQCGDKFFHKSRAARLCMKCVKSNKKARISRSLSKANKESGNMLARNSGAACETMFKLFCDLNGLLTYWPMSGTNPGVDCIMQLDGNLYKIQIKANQMTEWGESVFRWANRESQIKPFSCDFVVCMDIQLNGFIVIDCEHAIAHRQKSVSEDQIIAIGAGQRSRIAVEMLIATGGHG